MTAHLTWETLNELAGTGGPPEGVPPEATPRALADAGAAAQLHLAECARCRDALASLRALDAAAHSLPASIEPPEALWGAISATIAASGRAPARASAGASAGASAAVEPAATPASRSATVLPLPAGAVRRPGPRRVLQVETRRLAAAALVLMTLTAAATAWLLRPDGSASVAAGGGVSGGGAVAVTIPASFAATERAYLDDVAELQKLLDAQRPRLTAETIAVVERALATIDAAIAEARLALVADPANQELAELLAAGYRQKVELLRRAAEVTGTT